MAVGITFAGAIIGNTGITTAGAMIYVVVEELIPESQVGKHSNIGTIGVALAFVIMIILDIALR